MKRIASLAFIGALALASLTACSSEGGDVADFCSLSTSLDEGGALELDDLSDEAMEAALAGDMSGVNDWGTSASAKIDDITAQITEAKDGAPTDEVAQALDDVAEGLALMHGFTDAAADATDFLALMTEAEDLGSDIEAADAKMTAASDVLDAAEVEYCS